MNIQTLKKRISKLEIKAIQPYVFRSLTEEMSKVTDEEIEACYEKYKNLDFDLIFELSEKYGK